MKILGISFSHRKNGNCFKTLEYSLKQFQHDEIELISIYDYDINPCKDCDYHCFYEDGCVIDDDVKKLYEKCFYADIILLSLPTYSSHLPSSYFMWTERQQSIIRDDVTYVKDFLKKIHFILIGNKNAGADMALREILYPYFNQDFLPEVCLLQSQMYHQRSIDGHLIQHPNVKQKLKEYAECIKMKVSL